MQPVYAGCFLHCQEVLRLKKGKDQNYLDFVPVKKPEIEYHMDEKGKVILLIEWKGFYAKIAQKFFHRPRVSEIAMDDYGSFVWNLIDGEKDVHAISLELEKKFPKMENALSRLIKFMEILKEQHLIFWKGEEKKA